MSRFSFVHPLPWDALHASARDRPMVARGPVVETSDLHLEQPRSHGDLHRQVLLTTNCPGKACVPDGQPTTSRSRLALACQQVLVQLADPDAEIGLRVVADSISSPGLEDTILSIARAFVDNAIRHGMYARLLGKIDVRLVSATTGTALIVSNDGWSVASDYRPGRGLMRCTSLAERHGGSIWLYRQTSLTYAELKLPSGAV